MKIDYTIFAILLLAASLASSAQPVCQSLPSRSSGTLAGLILDPGGARVPAARVIIEAKRFRREVLSADDGSYSIDLPEGKYKVRVEGDGFYPSRKKTVAITLNTTTKLDVTLKGIRHDESHP